MKKRFLICAAALMLPVCATMYAGGSSLEKDSKKKGSVVAEHLSTHFKPYGFIRNYFVFDSRESVAGTGELFYYLPKDNDYNALNEDMNKQPSFKFLSLTSRLGLDVVGYQVGKTHFGARIEADFYAGLSGNSKVTGTATFRLRQAYATIGWRDLALNGDSRANVDLKIGQAWHPMAADMPDIFSLSSGSPFGPFSRTPQITMDASLGKHWIVSASALWQMQYTSTGPSGASADYIKYSCTPEIYAGISYRTNGFLARVGVDMLSIKPRWKAREEVQVPGEDGNMVTTETMVKVADRITTLSPYVYLQYKKDKFAVKAKTVYSSAGEHMGLMSGYGVSDYNGKDGSWEYTPLHSSSSWLSISYGKKVQGVLFAGFVKNLGTNKPLAGVTEAYPGESWAAGDESIDVADASKYATVYFSKNGFSNLNAMYRITPAVLYNVGKFTLGLEYELTSVQYGKRFDLGRGDDKTVISVVNASNGLVDSGLHWVTNHRAQMMVKFSF